MEKKHIAYKNSSQNCYSSRFSTEQIWEKKYSPRTRSTAYQNSNNFFLLQKSGTYRTFDTFKYVTHGYFMQKCCLIALSTLTLPVHQSSSKEQGSICWKAINNKMHGNYC